MSESHDLWDKARDAQREDVHRIFATRPRTCPSCGETGEVSGALCPFCRAPYTQREKGFRITPRRLAIAGAVVAALAIGAAVLVPGMLDDAADERRAEAALLARIDAAEEARIRQEQRPVTAAGPARAVGETQVIYRPRLVAAAEVAIADDARKRVAAGAMDGPVAGVQCTPYPNTQSRRDLEFDPDVRKNRYECFVYERRVALPDLEGQSRTGLLGVPYWMVADYETADLVFCKITPRAGEAGLRTGVLVPEPCRDPLG